MKMCEIARDLAPLYFDGEASAESVALISAHLKECDKCRAYYESCKSIAHPSLGIVGKKRYRYSSLAREIEIERIKETAVVAAITSIVVGTVVYRCLKGKK